MRSESSEANESASLDEAVDAAEFAPAEPTDNRERGQWKTRYPDKLARKWIKIEAAYVATVFFGGSLACLLLSLNLPTSFGWVDDAAWGLIKPYTLSFFGGAIGGSLFAMKWLYHSVAKEVWNIDRRLWRFFTPMLSAGAAVTVVVLSAGGIIPLFGKDLVRTGPGALGVALLVGYFSDRTFSMLERMANQQFGLPKSQARE